ncbi:MAG: 3-dehydroquinate synthase [candidate division Zixibacteria bacterium]|nr:3-dehydroquinate synthase [candidate division Zixibacteria bacterium]
MPPIEVELKDRAYPVITGAGRVKRLSALLRNHAPEGRVFVFYDARFYALHGSTVHKALKLPSERLFELTLPPGEKTKSLTQARKIYDILLGEKMTRSDFILACGGGVTGDLVGFIAATLLRGIPWAVVPTTLLAMVDAAVGGKTGVNHRRGKNLIGAFWQPKFVLGDLHFLHTLPFRQIVCGLGEIVKYAGLTGNKMLLQLKEYLRNGDFYNERFLAHLIESSLNYKAGLVTADERDESKRRFLNFGHTFAHAIENAAGYGRLLHGEAVILGTAAAVETGILLKPESEKYFREYRVIIEDMIKLVPRRRLDLKKIMGSMTWDKKRKKGTSRFVLLSRPGQPFIVDNPDKKVIKAALIKTLTKYQSGGGQYA